MQLWNSLQDQRHQDDDTPVGSDIAEIRETDSTYDPRHPLLAAGEEQRLGKALREHLLALGDLVDGDLPSQVPPNLVQHLDNAYRLRDALVQHNIRLVYYVARRFQGRQVDLEDLVQEGIMGLMRASLRFDPDTGVRFSTYAYWWILQAIQQAVTQQRSLIRFPSVVSQHFHQLHAFRQRFRDDHGRWPTLAESAHQLSQSEDDIRDLLSLSNYCISAHTPLYDDATATVIDALDGDDIFQPPDEAAAEQEESRLLEQMLRQLSEREASVLRLRFGIGRQGEATLREVAALLGISAERVRQIEREALVKLQTLPAQRSSTH